MLLNLHPAPRRTRARFRSCWIASSRARRSISSGSRSSWHWRPLRSRICTPRFLPEIWASSGKKNKRAVVVQLMFACVSLRIRCKTTTKWSNLFFFPLLECEALFWWNKFFALMFICIAECDCIAYRPSNFPVITDVGPAMIRDRSPVCCLKYLNGLVDIICNILNTFIRRTRDSRNLGRDSWAFL